MRLELPTPAEMAEIDRRAVAAGPFDGIGLMQRAGAAVAAEVLARYSDAPKVHVLAGPGNNGGDGYVVARLLHESGVRVSLWGAGTPRLGTDVSIVVAECPVERFPLADFTASSGELVVDALYGAGLSRNVDSDAARVIDLVTRLRLPVVAVDLPSGVSGRSGQVLGSAFNAEVTITFARKKPGHLLLPGRRLCGEVVLADIGISDAIIDTMKLRTFENAASLWCAVLPVPDEDTHKYRRGHVGVFSGGPASTGAARLSALAAARSGAGAVTLLSPANAMHVNAAHLTSIMLRKVSDAGDLADVFANRSPSAFVLGPGFGVGEKARSFALEILRAGRLNSVKGLVLDADGITSFGEDSGALFAAAALEGAPALVLTPHEGEFSRLFPDIAGDDTLSKLDRARRAASHSHGIVVYKGADTVIASPDGRAAINSNGVPWLATAGSGDVLAGIVAGLLAQHMPAFEAACAGVWMHAESTRAGGPGLIAEDLPAALVPVLHQLHQPPFAARSQG